MRNNQSGLQRLGEILNASSETFMLIALVSLFAIPFVIGANMEPIVKEAERAADRPSTAIIRTFEESPNTAARLVPTVGGHNVLGVSTQNKPFSLTEDKINLSYFDVNKSELKDVSYTLELSTNQVFGKISLVTLKNDSSEEKTYKINVSNLNTEKASGKFVYVGNTEYDISANKLPQNFSLAPGKEAQISLMSNQSKNTKLLVSLELVK